MSIDLNWETLTTGPDGQELAHRIRDFIHSKFQTVPLPRFIKSVTVHDFEFGSIGPELELKDITDPLPDFYEEDAEGDDDEDGSGGSNDSGDDDSDDGPQFSDEEELRRQRRRRQRQQETASGGYGGGPPRRDNERYRHSHAAAGGGGGRHHRHDLSGSSHQTITGLGGATTPATAGAAAGTRGGVPGGTSNLLHHFHSHLTPAGWSGTQTPLAAMAGAHLGGGGGNGGSYFDPHNYDYSYASRQATRTPSPSHSRNPSHSSSISASDFYRESVRLTPANASGGAASSPPSNHPSLLNHPALREKHSVSTLAPTSAGGASRPPTRDGKQRPLSQVLGGSAIADQEDDSSEGDNDMDRTLLLGRATGGPGGRPSPSPRPRREPRAEDMQAVFRIRYAGDVKLLLTADILLDYPMPSFVGIPVRLSITGLTFDGVGVLANIRKRVHFCFLSPEDALAAVGDDEPEEDAEDETPIIDDDRVPPTTPRRRPTTSTVNTAASPAPSVPPPPPRTKMGGLLQEVRVESEIGQRESGKQSLKNVGKVERFVLEQVRRIFEEEFVYPSFWTFLV
ncbi:Mitochondrial distribution and morphology protein 12 [Sporothrix bragantina]|uniref:Mitochondrial distribution and morphology protein 12 n=1 Tax=Sporothrix bragantina TaxID=671064 RepID=A0ABP0CVY5_9PEZI